MTRNSSRKLPAPPAKPDEAADPLSGYRWTPVKQAAFLRQLSATHSVGKAADAVGMSRQSAYSLRSRLKGKAFDLAWDVAFHHSYDNLAHAALERALNGVEVPVFFQGEQVGSYRKFDERLTVALLHWSTAAGNVPLLGKHGPAAERHARAFEALVAKVEAGDEIETGAESDPDAPGELERVRAAASSFISNSEILATLREFGEDGGY
jgi:hypothetical protein